MNNKYKFLVIIFLMSIVIILLNEKIKTKQPLKIKQDTESEIYDSAKFLSDKEIVNLAKKRAEKAINIPKEINPILENVGDISIVEWPLEQTDPPVAQGDYYARVKLNRITGEIINILIAP